jgi:hypothetical protein
LDFIEGICRIVTSDGKSVKSLSGYWETKSTAFYYKQCGIFEDVLKAEDFKPFVKHTLPIPEAVQALDGYGWGIINPVYRYPVYNYIDLKNKKFAKRIGKVDIGTLNFEKNDSVENEFHAIVPNILFVDKNYTIICDKYVASTTREDGTMFHGANRVYIRDFSYTDAATFKAAMAGVMLYYELAEPIITDISDLITADNLIGVEGGGTLTFENEYGYAVPSEVEYQVEV